MPETTSEVDIPADPCEAAMDAAAAELSGLNLVDAADHAWQSLVAITGGSQIDNVDRHRAIVALACQVKPLRDHLIVQAVQHGDLSLPALARTPSRSMGQTETGSSTPIVDVSAGWLPVPRAQ